MKRLFGREKPKIVKTPSAASELGSEDAQYFDGQHYQQPLQPYDRMHSQDRAHGLVHSSSDEHWDMVNSHDGHSPIPSAYIPRAASPFSGTVSVSSHKSNGDRDSNFRKKPPNTPSPAAAVGILRALDPHHSQAATTPSPREYDRETLDDSVQPKSMEKKERKGFWERTKDRDKEKERPKEEERKERLGNVLRPREKEKEKEKKDGELTRMIGYLTATSSEDWSLVLEVCERASANEAAARETVKALRDEFKYADPTAKLAAARLWAVLLQNASGIFMTQSTSRKFLDTLEDVIQSPRTSPVVKERLLQVLAAAAYAGSARHNHLEKDPFRALWRKVKAPNQPDEGIPLDPEDAMLNPPVTAVTPLPETPRTATQKPPNKHKPSSRIIPPEEDIRRLFEECKYAHGNASLLSDALVHARPEDLQGKAIIKEFYARCRASQELIYAQIPWASANAERSRGAAAATPRRHRASPPDSPQAESEETVEEQLLGELLSANEQLTEALKVYEDLERIKTEREVEERSRKDTRMKYKDRPRHHNNTSESSIPTSGGHARSTPVPPRSPSPSPSPSPPPSVTVTPFTPTHTHPLPPIPQQKAKANQINAQQQLAALALQQQVVNLAPPPPAPHGPRRPAPSHRSADSRSPSPTNQSFATGPPSIRTTEDWERQSYRHSVHTPRGHAYSNILEMDDDSGSGVDAADSEEFEPVPQQQRPSAKALGKRRVVEPDESDSQFDPDDMFYEHNNDSRHSEPLDDADSDGDGNGLRQKRSVQYVYDAAAEKTRERIREGRLHLAETNATALVAIVH